MCTVLPYVILFYFGILNCNLILFPKYSAINQEDVANPGSVKP